MIGFSSEPQEMVDRARSEWGIGFEMHGDPINTIPTYLLDAHNVRLCVKGMENSMADVYVRRVHPFMKKYAHGVVQPGMVFISKTKGVLYAWHAEVNLRNGGGAFDRPAPKYALGVALAVIQGKGKPATPPEMMNAWYSEPVIFVVYSAFSIGVISCVVVLIAAYCNP